MSLFRRSVVEEIDVHRLDDAIRRGGATLIDVREPHEYNQAHVDGSQLIPLGSLPSRVHELPSDGPVYVICATGNRSESATQFLTRNGISAFNVAGGIMAWMRSRKPVKRGR